ncbi:MAG TPA: hypothetical protein VFV89_09185 [Nocardioides sp.]|uniref:hypothetical protein n=1 Tax=Nocardioides sp. TaxID=35761 RepID=UPI002E2F9384|nr:hypothetical protein [Nocardioides sp.]HEX5087971.1 hypothetical protein [Nocardioides sp.]
MRATAQLSRSDGRLVCYVRASLRVATPSERFEVIERHVMLGSDEGAIAIRSSSEQSIRVAGELGDNTVVSDPPGIDGELWLLPADQWGPFEVTTRVLEGHPGPPDQSWEDVVEFTVTTEGAVVVTELVNNDPTAPWLDEPGQWRTRVSTRGRSVPDPADEPSDAEDDPVEWWLLEAWPAAADEALAQPEIVRLTSAWAQAQRSGLPPPLHIPEGESGLAAANRIGRDVDQASGARELSGRLGSVEVSRTMRGTRRRLFNPCAHLVTWSHAWLPAPTWSFSGPGLVVEQPGKETWAWSDDHADQLTGSRGAVLVRFVELDKPRRVVRTWNWVRRVGERGPSPFARGAEVLADDSVLTISLDESKRDAETWTTIRIEHAAIPVEWVEDLRDYWAYQLAIADQAGFGLPKA